MAGTNRRSPPDVMEQVLTESRGFSFVQAMRLLRRRLRDSGDASGNPFDRIRVRPDLTLAFPGTDITSIEREGEDPERFLVTVSFLGLYGASSPLPTFYTEDLLHERENDGSIARDFLDIINSSVYPLLFACWSKYRLFYKLIEEEDPATLERFFSLLGVESARIRDRLKDPYRLLRYTGLATQMPRSAEGLRAMLVDSIQEESLRIEQCVERQAVIPEDQRLILGRSGNVLGQETVLGREISDRMGAFRVCVGPCDGPALHRLLPDGPVYAIMQERIRFYLDQTLEWDLEVRIRAEEIGQAGLGNASWSRLGWNTWVFSGPPPAEEQRVRLCPAPFDHPQFCDGSGVSRHSNTQEGRP